MSLSVLYMYVQPTYTCVCIGSLDIAAKICLKFNLFLNNFVIKHVTDSFTEYLLFFILIL
jgi:hypothetical protein